LTLNRNFVNFDFFDAYSWNSVDSGNSFLPIYFDDFALCESTWLAPGIDSEAESLAARGLKL